MTDFDVLTNTPPLDSTQQEIIRAADEHVDNFLSTDPFNSGALNLARKEMIDDFLRMMGSFEEVFTVAQSHFNPDVPYTAASTFFGFDGTGGILFDIFTEQLYFFAAKDIASYVDKANLISARISELMNL